MKLMKKVIPFALVCLLLCAWIPMTVGAEAEADEVDKMELVLEDATITAEQLDAIGDNSSSEWESNNTEGTADRVYHDYTVSGSVSNYDLDYFKLVVSSTTTIRITVVGDNSYLMCGLKRGGVSSYLRSVKTSLQSTSSGYTYGATLSYTVTAGTYYIVMLNSISTTSNRYVFYVSAPSSSASTHTHSYYAYSTVKPTCTSQGYTVYKCSCGASYNGNYVAQKAHTAGDWQISTEATCTTDGSRYKKCTSCGTTMQTEAIPAGHQLSEWTVTKAPTSGQNGSMSMICASCGENVYTRSIKKGFNSSSGVIVYVNSDGTLMKNGWKDINGAWYYFGANGQAAVNSWIAAGYEWRYVGKDGKIVTNDWAMADDGWRYLDANGLVETNTWVTKGSAYYYLGADGRIATNSWIAAGYEWRYVGKDGKIVTNDWAMADDGLRYLDANGLVETNTWIMKGGAYYYLGADGRMVTNQWLAAGYEWRYVGKDGKIVTNDWAMADDGWRYLDDIGLVETNTWAIKNGEYYYLGADGRIVTSQWLAAGYEWRYVGKDGKIVTNDWVMADDGWRYMDASGHIATNTWAAKGSKWYYLGAGGSIATNTWANTDEGMCYIGANGQMVTNRWLQDSKGWRYVGANGRVVTNDWVQADKGLCYVGSDGYIARAGWKTINGKTYYLDAYGCATTGWKTIGGKRYYFHKAGDMAINMFKDGGYIGSNGVWIAGGNPYDVEYNTLVYSDSRVSIRFKQVTKDAILFTVENKTSGTITIQADAIALNGRSTENITMSDDVAPYSTGVVSARCSIEGVFSVGEISGQLRVISFSNRFQSYDASFDRVVTDSSITDVAPSVNLPLIYSDAKVDIYYKETTASGMVFTVRNKTGILLTIQANSISVNGYSTDNITMSDDVAPHSVGDVVAQCSVGIYGSSVYKVGGELRIIDFNDSFRTYSATFSNKSV